MRWSLRDDPAPDLEPGETIEVKAAAALLPEHGGLIGGALYLTNRRFLFVTGGASHREARGTVRRYSRRECVSVARAEGRVMRGGLGDGAYKRMRLTFDGGHHVDFGVGRVDRKVSTLREALGLVR
jgi:hypothetical protein